MSRQLQRAELLMEQRRYDDAEAELRQHLLNEPEHARAHALLAMCLSEREQFADATAHARQSIAAAPDDEFSHYTLACVMLERNRPAEALPAIDEALRLDPYWPQAFGLKGAIYLRMKQWKPALDAANSGLAIDPDDVQCINVRGLALVQLGDRSTATATVERALQQNPENPVSHANMGWAALHGGDHRKALEHFREALRLDPESEWARNGMVEALKARNVVYRQMLKFFLWAGRLSGQAQLYLILGLIFGQRILRSGFAQFPGLEWAADAILALYLLFVIMTWTAQPLFNLLLRFDRFGRHVLSRKDVVVSNWLLVYLLAAFAVGGLFLWTLLEETNDWTRSAPLALMTAVQLVFLVIPLTATFGSVEGWPKLSMGAITVVLTTLAYGGIAAGFLLGDAELMFRCLTWSFVGTVISTWVAMGTMRVEKRH